MALILLLEDDLALSAQLAEILGAEGHDLVAFDHVGKAMDYVETNAVDLIIADLFLPPDETDRPRGGVTLISNLKQVKSSDIPIIAISGKFLGSGGTYDNSPLIRDTAITVGANAILAKPFAPQKLLDLIDAMLAQKA